VSFESVYGSRPRSLPSSVVELARTQGGRAWVGRHGAELLDATSHSTVEVAAFRQFDRRSDGRVSWESVLPEAILFSEEASSATLSRALGTFADSSEPLTFLWDSLAVPSVRAGRQAAVSLALEAVDLFAEFWIMSTPAKVLFEFPSLEDHLVVASLELDTSEPPCGLGEEPVR